MCLNSTKIRWEHVARDVLKALVDLYIGKYKVEDIQLDTVLLDYSIGGVVDVKIGSVGEELYYTVHEPKINGNKLDEILSDIVGRVLSGLEDAEDPKLKSSVLNETIYNYVKVTSGWGPLLPCISDPYVEDIFVSKSSNRVHVVHNKFSWIGWLKTNIVLDPELVDRLVLSLSRRIGKHVSLVNPLVEGSYGDNYRVSLIYGKTVSPHGSSIVVRKRGINDWTITRLINEGTLSSTVTSYLWLVLENRGWIIIAGHVGSGKTTLLQALLTLIPPYKKVITIEDTPEITGTTGLWEQLIEKNEAFTRLPQIDSFTLLRFALRRRPDYIVIGEVRGIEARLLVQASRLGHGVLNTIHADSPDSVLKRLIAPPISIPKNLLNNIWTIVVMSAHGDRRRVSSVTEINNDVSQVEICSDHGEGCEVDHIINSTVRLTRVHSRDTLRHEILKRAMFLESLVSRGVFSTHDLRLRILEFYNSVEEVLAEK